MREGHITSREPQSRVAGGTRMTGRSQRTRRSPQQQPRRPEPRPVSRV